MEDVCTDLRPQPNSASEPLKRAVDHIGFKINAAGSVDFKGKASLKSSSPLWETWSNSEKNVQEMETLRIYININEKMSRLNNKMLLNAWNNPKLCFVSGFSSAIK